MENKVALITGVTGQDGSYLAELLINKGYTVHGMVRRSSSIEKTRIDHLYEDPHEKGVRLFLEYGDLADSSSIRHILNNVNPDEVYNLAAQSHVKVSFEQPEYTSDVVATGVIRILDAIRDYNALSNKQIKFYQASSSEIFGIAPPPQNEQSPFMPQSPYAVGKLSAYWNTVNYRNGYGLHASNGILFNHESERRGENFVTRKITRAVGRIKHGLQEKLFLGNLDAKRDWGHAKDFVEAMWLILQQENADDYVIATGFSHSVREFLEAAFSYANLDWKKYVETDPYYYRPTEVDYLLGNPKKAKEKLGWEPKILFEDLVAIMVDHDIELAARETYNLKYKL